MRCRRCRKCISSTEGIKCSECESIYHIRCSGHKTKDLQLESGDKDFHWVCGRCKAYTNKAFFEHIDPKALLNAVNGITEKFELVNKIQLPKLNNDLLYLKCVTEQISKQNEEILSNIKLINKRGEDPALNNPVNRLRRRNLIISPRSRCCDKKCPAVGTEKSTTYRTRRRSYSLFKMFLKINRKLYNRKSSKTDKH